MHNFVNFRKNIYGFDMKCRNAAKSLTIYKKVCYNNKALKIHRSYGELSEMAEGARLEIV